MSILQPGLPATSGAPGLSMLNFGAMPQLQQLPPSAAFPQQLISSVDPMSMMPQKDSRWLTLEVCREYQRNKCTRTDLECKFAHPPAHVEVVNGRVIACYDSMKGRCHRKEPPCKYLHPPQHLREQLMQNGKNTLILRNLQLRAVAAQHTIPGMMPVYAGAAMQQPLQTQGLGASLGGMHSPGLVATSITSQSSIGPSTTPNGTPKLHTPKVDRVESAAVAAAAAAAGVPPQGPGPTMADLYQHQQQQQQAQGPPPPQGGVGQAPGIPVSAPSAVTVQQQVAVQAQMAAALNAAAAVKKRPRDPSEDLFLLQQGSGVPMVKRPALDQRQMMLQAAATFLPTGLPGYAPSPLYQPMHYQLPPTMQLATAGAWDLGGWNNAAFSSQAAANSQLAAAAAGQQFLPAEYLTGHAPAMPRF